jgi:hypothetical protein
MATSVHCQHAEHVFAANRNGALCCSLHACMLCFCIVTCPCCEPRITHAAHMHAAARDPRMLHSQQAGAQACCHALLLRHSQLKVQGAKELEAEASCRHHHQQHVSGGTCSDSDAGAAHEALLSADQWQVQQMVHYGCSDDTRLDAACMLRACDAARSGGCTAACCTGPCRQLLHPTVLVAAGMLMPHP